MPDSGLYTWERRRRRYYTHLPAACFPGEEMPGGGRCHCLYICFLGRRRRGYRLSMREREENNWKEGWSSAIYNLPGRRGREEECWRGGTPLSYCLSHLFTTLSQIPCLSGEEEYTSATAWVSLSLVWVLLIYIYIYIPYSLPTCLLHCIHYSIYPCHVPAAVPALYM